MDHRRKVINMTISKERKAELMAQYGKNAQDTGNSKVQVVGKRRRLLSYIKKNDINEYRELIAQLGIRDNIQ